ncbi:MFS transporter [Sediminibacterium soli]|uniref:MFS transporter n=1 Tax=Sediminibacterium soli TaxID=2698829 RepID=UPI00137941A9|nr:MFS transporter [Sediminibacterium soli]NCI47277.1 MFS transporter [Sediminibacterium soli]
MTRSSTAYFNFQFGLLCFSNFLFSCSFSMMIPELPGYLTQLGGAEYKGLIIALFTLMAGISRPFSGKLTDTVGRVPVMIFGSLVCVVCSLLYPVLTTVSGFLLLRFFHGFSTGFKPTATSAYGADVVHESRRGEAMGMLALGYSLGSSVGPLIGSWLVTDFSYRIMFYVSSGFALGSVAILYNIRETLRHPQKFSFRYLRVGKDEIFEKTALKPAVIMLLLCFSIGSVLTLSPDLSMSVGIQNKGLFYAVYTVASLLIRLVAGKSSDKYGRVIVLIFTALLQCIAFVVLAFSHSVTMVMVSAVIYGFSVGMNGPTLMAWAVDLCRAENRGRAVASVYIALEMGIGCGALVSAWIYNNRLSNLIYAFFLTSALALVAMGLLISWKRRERHKVAAMAEAVELAE